VKWPRVGGLPIRTTGPGPPKGHGTRGGLSGKERTALKRQTSRANGTKFGRPRKVDDAEHIATAKLMKADGDTPDVASVVLGVQRMFASTNGCPWACVVPCEWGRVGSPGSRTPSQRRSRIWRRRCRCTTCITPSLVRTRPLTKQANGYKMTPAMAAGIERRIWTHTDIAALLD
jgi:hypothetical protein